MDVNLFSDKQVVFTSDISCNGEILEVYILHRLNSIVNRLYVLCLPGNPSQHHTFISRHLPASKSVARS